MDCLIRARILDEQYPDAEDLIWSSSCADKRTLILIGMGLLFQADWTPDTISTIEISRDGKTWDEIWNDSHGSIV